MRRLSFLEFVGGAVLYGVVGILLTLSMVLLWAQDKSIVRAARTAGTPRCADDTGTTWYGQVNAVCHALEERR